METLHKPPESRAVFCESFFLAGAEVLDSELPIIDGLRIQPHWIGDRMDTPQAGVRSLMKSRRVSKRGRQVRDENRLRGCYR